MATKCARAVFGSLIVLALAACSGKPPAPQAGVKVTDISVGRSLSSDKSIADKTESFAPADTVYVSVRTEGVASSATLAARWTFEDGQLVEESNQTIAPNGPEVIEFHVAKPSGWPAGNYKVEVLLNGASAGSKDFKVS